MGLALQVFPPWRQEGQSFVPCTRGWGASLETGVWVGHQQHLLQVISPGESQGEGGENIVGWESRGRRD